MSRLDRALHALLAAIDYGAEYPDARERVARAYGVDSEALAVAYDLDQCTDHDSRVMGVRP